MSVAPGAPSSKGRGAGSTFGKQIVADQRGLLTKEQIRMKKQQDKLVDGIMQSYDKNDSGDLDEKELRPMLRDYSGQIYGEQCQPTDDDMEFIFSLYEKKDAVGRAEVLQVCDAWGEFVKQKEVVIKLFETHDDDKSCSIDAKELQSLLDELKEGKVATVPAEVTKWILEQSDVNRNNVLSQMELARALCAFELWATSRAGGPVAPSALAQNIEAAEAQPAPEAPPPSPPSQCCVVS